MAQIRPPGLDFRVKVLHRLRVGRDTTRAEDTQGTLTESHISPSILVYDDKTFEVVPSSLGSGPTFINLRRCHLCVREGDALVQD